MGPNGEQFISVLPVPSGGTASAGNFTYYSPDGQPIVGPTYIINPQQPQQPQQQEKVRPPAGSPNRGQNTADSQRQAQSGGRNARDKAGRGKRSNGRREAKPTASAVSPLLETFKAKKNRNWTVLDIAGETNGHF